MLAFAKKNIHAPNVQWIISDGSNFPVLDNSVSNVFTCHVFQHFESPEVISAYFQESFRVLRSGGRIFVHVPIHIFPLVNRGFSRLVKLQYQSYLSLSYVKAMIMRFRMWLGG